MKRIEIILNNTKIKSPFLGLINKYFIHNGDIVNKGTLIASIVAFDLFKVSFDIFQSQRLNIVSNLPCCICICGRYIKGFISHVDFVSNRNSKILKGEVCLLETDKNLFFIEGINVNVMLVRGSNDLLGW